MAKDSSTQPGAGRGTLIRFNLPALVVFSFCLVLASGFLGYYVAVRAGLPGNNGERAAGNVATNPPPWGELITRDMLLEPPEEFVANETRTNREARWVFEGWKPEAVRGLLLTCGLASSQLEHALSPALLTATPSNTIIRPDDKLVLSLAPAVREKLYGELSRFAANPYMVAPFTFRTQRVDSFFEGRGVSKEALELVRQLTYQRGDVRLFSDYELVLGRVPAPEQRRRLVSALWRQPAVMGGVRIRADTDTDRLLTYWTIPSGVQIKDLRPLLESLKRTGTQESLSFLYLLPPFARDRLLSSPSPGGPADPRVTAYWGSLNFSNEKPDNRFLDANYCGSYLKAHYYRVARPTWYGDLIFFVDDQGNATHSAVYVADDIVFTISGANFNQPWKLMRIRDLLAMHGMTDFTRNVVVYRNEAW
jgi:hypothetical protein